MEEYEPLLTRTRNLEQKYITRLLSNYNNKIRVLNEEIKQSSIISKTNIEYESQIHNLTIELENLKDQHDKTCKLLYEQSKEENSLKRGKKDDSKNKEYQNTIKELNKKLEAEQELRRQNESKIIEEYENKMAEIIRTQQKTNKGIKNISGPDQSKEIEEIKKMQKELMKSLNKSFETAETRMVKVEGYLKNITQNDSKAIFETANKLKEEISLLKEENEQLKIGSKKINEQKDNVILLKDVIESKNKTIEIQNQQIQKLNEKLNKKTNNENILLEDLKNPFETEKNIDPWALNMPKVAPVIKKGKTLKKEASKKENKPISVENIIRDENKSFFNNLSFNNSSPVVGQKRVKKNFNK